MTNTQILTERDLFRSFWDDGLLDILGGMALLLTGLGWESQLGPLAVVQAPLWIVLWTPLRRRLVEPRAGFVRFALERRRRNTIRLSWTVALGLGLFALVAVAALVARERGSLPTAQQAVDGLPALLVALAAGLAGFLTGAKRFHAYGLGLVAGAAVTMVFPLGPAAPLVMVGMAAVATGLFLLTRFVRDSRDHRERS